MTNHVNDCRNSASRLASLPPLALSIWHESLDAHICVIGVIQMSRVTTPGSIRRKKWSRSEYSRLSLKGSSPKPRTIYIHRSCRSQLSRKFSWWSTASRMGEACISNLPRSPMSLFGPRQCQGPGPVNCHSGAKHNETPSNHGDTKGCVLLNQRLRFRGSPFPTVHPGYRVGHLLPPPFVLMIKHTPCPDHEGPARPK